MNWKFILRQNENLALDKPKIYMLLSSNDAAWYDELTQLFLSSFNCAICRSSNNLNCVEKNDWKVINAFAILISDYLLKNENTSLDKLYSIAKENNIPLFFFRISNIDFIFFESKYGNIHIFDATLVHDKDKNSFLTEKLRNSLFTILGSEKELAQIKENFDSQFFLSYRKKDYKHIKALLSEIRRNELLRDCAIWYDDALIPGENYQKAIQSQIKDSSLFFLLVTNSLLEKHNYVERIEYPFAKQNNIPIIPFLLEKTDVTELNKIFPSLPKCTDISKVQELEKTLEEICASQKITELDNSPQHLYFIGLAYLWGIGMGKNENLAISLLSNSAKHGYIDSWLKLGLIYANGIGVEANSSHAIDFLEQYLLNYQKNNVFPADNFLQQVSLTDDQYSQYEKDIRTISAIRILLQLYKANHLCKNEILDVIASICNSIAERTNAFVLLTNTFSNIVGYEIIKNDEGVSTVGKAIYADTKIITVLLPNSDLKDVFHMLVFDFTDSFNGVYETINHIIAVYESMCHLATTDDRFSIPALLKPFFREIVSLCSLAQKMSLYNGNSNMSLVFKQKELFYNNLLSNNS